MDFNELEQKLIRLALCNSAREGEIINSAEMLFKKLRARNVTPEQFMRNNNSSWEYESLYRTAQYRVNQLASELVNATGIIGKLKAELLAAQQARPAQQANSASYTPGASTGQPRRTYQPRTRSGYRFLTDNERALLMRSAQRAEQRDPNNMLAAMYNIARTHQEHGTIQQLLKKGMIEKGWSRGYHKLTQKGLDYYNTYKQYYKSDQV